MTRAARVVLLAALLLVVLLAGILCSFPDIRITTSQGDWETTTAGLRPSGRAGAFAATERALVRFDRLGGAKAEIALTLAARDTAVPVRLVVLRGTEVLHDMLAPKEPTRILVTVPEGQREVDLWIRAEPQEKTPRTLYRVSEVTLHRKRPAAGWTAGLPLLVGLAALGMLRTRRLHAAALLWSVVVVLGFAGAWVVLVDPSAGLLLRPSTRWTIRLVGLAGLWALALWRPRPGAVVVAAAVVGTVGVLYLPTLHFGFVNEDFNFAHPWTWREIVSTFHGHWDPRGAVAEYYRPLVSASLALDYLAWGGRPEGYHGTNLVLHSINGLLAVGLLGRLGLSRRGALAGSLAWLSHPMSATAAAWTNQRTDALMAIFYLGALFVLLSPRLSRAGILAACGLGLLSLGCKEMAVTLPLAGLLVTRTAPDPGVASQRRLALVGLALVTAAYLAFWLSLFPHRLDAAGGGLVWKGFDSGRAADWLGVVPGLYAPVFIPVDGPDWRMNARTWSPLYFGAGLLLAPFIWWLLGRVTGQVQVRRVALLGMAWPIATIGPALGIRQVDIFRLGLLVCLGFALAWGALVTHGGERHRLAWVLGSCALLLWTSPLALKTAADWGPGGYYKSLLWNWRTHNGEKWWNSLTPEMRSLFYAELGRESQIKSWAAVMPPPVP